MRFNFGVKDLANLRIRAAMTALLALALAGCPGSKSDPTYNIGFNFHLIDMEGDRADASARVEAMMSEVRRVMKAAKFEVDSVEIYVYTGPDAQRLTHTGISLDSSGDLVYEDNDGNGWPDNMDELLTWSARTPNQNIDVFLVKSISDSGFILGAAGDIPGPAQKGTKHSGVLLETFGGIYQMNQAELALQGGTLAHESVHYLGVYHTTEQEGLDFDYLKDTPECPQWTFDRNHDQRVSATECYDQDGQYLMFWLAANFPQDKISGDQASAIKAHPLARKK